MPLSSTHMTLPSYLAPTFTSPNSLALSERSNWVMSTLSSAETERAAAKATTRQMVLRIGFFLF